MKISGIGRSHGSHAASMAPLADADDADDGPDSMSVVTVHAVNAVVAGTAQSLTGPDGGGAVDPVSAPAPVSASAIVPSALTATAAAAATAPAAARAAASVTVPRSALVGVRAAALSAPPAAPARTTAPATVKATGTPTATASIKMAVAVTTVATPTAAAAAASAGAVSAVSHADHATAVQSATASPSRRDGVTPSRSQVSGKPVFSGGFVGATGSAIPSVRGARGKGGGLRASAAAVDDGDDNALIDQLTGQLGADLIAIQPLGPRSKSRRSKRVGGLDSITGGIDTGDDVDDAPVSGSIQIAVVALPQAHHSAPPEGPLELQGPDDLDALEQLAMLAAMSRQAGVARAVPVSARAQGQPDASGIVPVAAPLDPLVASRHGRQSQAGNGEASDSNPGPTPPSIDDAGFDDGGDDGDMTPFQYLWPVLANRRLETNGVDDMLILMRAMQGDPVRGRAVPAGPPAVPEQPPMAADLPENRDPVQEDVIEQVAARDARKRFMRLPHHVVPQDRMRRSAHRRLILCGAVCPHQYRSAVRVFRSGRTFIPASDPRSPGMVECDDFWVRGCVMPAGEFHPVGMRIRGV